MNKTILCILPILICLSIASAIPGSKKKDVLREHTLLRFRQDARAFADASVLLKQELTRMTPEDTASITQATKALITTRLAYKKIEFFIEYFFTYPVNLYNRAPVYEIEEPYMEFQAPVGLQVIEGLLMEEDPCLHKKELLEQSEVIMSSALDIPSIIYGIETSDPQLATAIKLELVRVMTLGITGYDAPQLKTGIAESALALNSIKEVLLPVLEKVHTKTADSLLWYLDESIKRLREEVSFDNFDRMAFFTAAALPLQTYLNQFIKDQDWNSDNPSILNDKAKNLFSPNAFTKDSFLTYKTDTGTFVANLGRTLFFEKKLSGNGKRNCASCHRPEKYFTDALPKSLAFNEKEDLVRNAPTLLYASMQHGQFLDARSGTMEEQIVAVLENPLEMNAHMGTLVTRINNRTYRKLFRKAFPKTSRDSLITISRIARAIAAFERTLAPYNSSFDRYIQGDPKAMASSQIRGFNLFMGKAQCGTCHFAPLFNGLLPPLYTVTELEVLGVPKNGSLTNPTYDDDEGRYGVFKIKFYKGAFKTPTVRNVSATAPYMHNGSFKTLEELITFYNKGGGTGIGLVTPTQTLSSKPLNLSASEVKNIVHFMESLKDDVSVLY